MLSNEELRWYYFLGEVHLVHNAVDITPPWDWVPLFDAIYCVEQVMIFAQGGKALGRIDFTENDDSIDFSLRDGLLVGTPTYADCVLQCTPGEFVVAGNEFIRAELSKIICAYPALKTNAAVARYAERFGQA